MISFIVPARNEAGYILDCLKSIYAQNTQEDLEVVVVDNLSQDGTSKVVKENFPSAVLVSEKHPGTAAARQAGFLQSRGDILIFIDADVRLPDTAWLTRLLVQFKKSSLIAVSTHYKYYGMSKWYRAWQIFGTFGFVYPWEFFTNRLLRISAHMIGGMMVIGRQALTKAGGFDTGTEFFGDEAMLSRRLYPYGRIKMIPSVWVWTSGRRHNQQGMFKTVMGYLWNYFWVLFVKHPFNQKGYKEVR